MRTLLALVAGLVSLVTPIFAEATMLKPGDRFPDWSLVDHTGTKVSSKDLAGRSYLLWYYPKAETPGCTIEGQKLRDAAPSFASKGVEILGVSFDAPAANASFVENQSFPYRLLSDAERTLAVAVGAADSSDQGHAKRISYLVGGDGKVRKAYEKVNPSVHADEVLKDLAAP